jgi:hypothetical protein
VHHVGQVPDCNDLVAADRHRFRGRSGTPVNTVALKKTRSA